MGIVSFQIDEDVPKLIVVMATEFCKFTLKAIELYTFSG